MFRKSGTDALCPPSGGDECNSSKRNARWSELIGLLVLESSDTRSGSVVRSRSRTFPDLCVGKSTSCVNPFESQHSTNNASFDVSDVRYGLFQSMSGKLKSPRQITGQSTEHRVVMMER